MTGALDRVRAAESERGSAIVEFVLLAVVLVIPFVYAVLSIFAVERAAFSSAALTREAARAFVTADDGASARHRAEVAERLAAGDLGASAPEVTIRCDADPCLTPGARVTVTAVERVPLPLVPRIGSHAPPAVIVRARHVEVVDPFRAVRP